MLEVDPNLRLWGWFFLVIYIGAMLVFGYMGMRRVRSSDDFATARGGYGPVFLAFALTATAASGGTFIGIPALAYKYGFSTLWYAFVYPLGVYIGLTLCLRGIRRAGANFGTRSMPEYLGDRFDSEALRLCVSIFSMLLMFYLAGQLLSGGIMFNKMMGIELLPALIITAVIVMVYIVIGGAHADILTDGVQGALMLVLALAVTAMFFTGFGVDGGYDGMIRNLDAQDPDLLKTLNPKAGILNSWWDVFAIFVMHLPLGLLPHVGNKLWALKSDSDQVRFIMIAFVFGMTLPTIAFGGILARAVLGDELLPGSSANVAIPALFIATLPTWLAAFIGAGVLAAIMSTADGLVVSTSQVFANDIYRRSIAPRLKNKPSDATVDRVSLTISRIASVVVVAGSIWLAWESQSMNVAILIAAGVGGMIAATCGPIFTGILWRGTTKAGALAGFSTGALSFLVLKTGFLPPACFIGDGPVEIAGNWLIAQGPNPFACGTIGALISVFTVIVVSLVTEKPSKEHLIRVFGD
jgi:SSS family transporter